MHKQMKFYNANFDSDGLLDNGFREVRLFQKMKTKYLARTFFTHPTKVTGFMQFGKIFRIMCLPKICTKTLKKLE